MIVLINKLFNRIILNKEKIIKFENLNSNNKNILNTLIKHIDSEYYILTNLNNYSNDELKEIYKKRWGIETSFYFLKEKFNFKCNNSKNINIIKQNLYSSQFMMILIAYIQFLLKDFINKNTKINKTNAIELLRNNLLILLIFNNKINKSNTNDIYNILILISNKTIKIQIIIKYNNRSRKRPGTLWFSSVIKTPITIT